MPRPAAALLLAPVLALTLALTLALALPAPLGAQAGPQVDVKAQVERYIKASLPDPKAYEGQRFSQVVKFTDGPYAQAIRHTFRINDPVHGLLQFDDIFYLDPDGRVLGSTNTTFWKGPHWGAGKEKW